MKVVERRWAGIGVAGAAAIAFAFVGPAGAASAASSGSGENAGAVVASAAAHRSVDHAGRVPLVQGAGGLSAHGGHSTVTVSTGTRPQVTIQPGSGGDGAKLTVDLPASAGGAQASVDGGAAVMGGGASQTTVESLTDGGVRIAAVLDKGAPSRLAYGVDGATIRLQSDGSAVLTDVNGATEGVVDAPWASDARGQDIPTHYEIGADGSLVQVVDAGAVDDVAYPIVADPTYHWWGIQWTLSATNTTRLTAAIATAAGIAGVAAVLQGMADIPNDVAWLVASVLSIDGGIVGWCGATSRGIHINFFPSIMAVTCTGA